MDTRFIFDFYLFEAPDFRLLFEFWISLGFIVVENFMWFNCGIRTFHIDVILEALSLFSFSTNPRIKITFPLPHQLQPPICYLMARLLPCHHFLQHLSTHLPLHQTHALSPPLSLLIGIFWDHIIFSICRLLAIVVLNNTANAFSLCLPSVAFIHLFRCVPLACCIHIPWFDEPIEL